MEIQAPGGIVKCFSCRFDNHIKVTSSKENHILTELPMQKGSPKSLLKPRICSSHLLRLANPCCNACFTILLLNIIIIMPASQNRSNFAFRCGLRRLVTTSIAKSGLKTCTGDRSATILFKSTHFIIFPPLLNIRSIEQLK